MELFYIGGYSGQKIDLIAGDVCAEAPETLLKNRWDYTALGAIDNRSDIKDFRKGAVERKIVVQILADSADDFNRIMDGMNRIFEADVLNSTPGKLVCNGYSMDAYGIDVSHDAFSELMLYVRTTIKFLLPSPIWTKEQRFAFDAASEGTGPDYPHDYPHDFGRDTGGEFIRNDSIGPSHFKMVIYGPCADPVVTLGGHAYGLAGVTIAQGAYVVINSRVKEIVMVSSVGDRQNIFDYRVRSSYIFEAIPPGEVSLSRAQSLAFDLIVYDERGIPPWI